MRIQVTQEHIDKGERMNTTRCPIALALKDAGFEDPTVLTMAIDFGAWTVTTPGPVEDFIRSFDKGRDVVRPFSFDLDVEP